MTVTNTFLAFCRSAMKRPNSLDYHLWLNAVVEHKNGVDQVATVTVSERIPMPGCDPPDVTRRCPIPAKARIERFDRDYTSQDTGGGRTFSAHTTHYQTADRSAIRTLVALCKEGDELFVHFLIGNNTDYLRAAELTHDECYISVYRPNRSNRSKLTLIGDVYVDDVICPVNSLCRFVR